MPRSDVVGIDFGTTTTRVAWGEASVVTLGRTTVWLPSVARLVAAGVIVGEDADDAGPHQIRSIKRAITERRELVTIAGPEASFEVDADAVTVAVLAEAVARARRAGTELDGRSQVRLGCPALWDGHQRQRLLRAAGAAGLPVDDATLVDEPVAAGIAWLAHRYLHHGERPSGCLLVFDMGGGTLDVAVLEVAGRPAPQVRVLASLGLALAGDALDLAVARDLAAEMAANRIDVALHPRPDLAWALLERAGREAKVRLTSVAEHPVVLHRQLAYPQALRYRRDRLERAFADQFDGGYERISLHRPSVDFVLEWDGGGRHPLYEAFTPLYEPWQVYNGYSDLGFERPVPADQIPSSGYGWLRARSIAGRLVRLEVDGEALDGLPVRFGPEPVVFRVDCDGRLWLADGTGDLLSVSAAAWPLIAGDVSALALRRLRWPDLGRR